MSKTCEPLSFFIRLNQRENFQQINLNKIWFVQIFNLEHLIQETCKISSFLCIPLLHLKLAPQKSSRILIRNWYENLFSADISICILIQLHNVKKSPLNLIDLNLSRSWASFFKTIFQKRFWFEFILQKILKVKFDETIQTRFYSRFPSELHSVC